MAHLGGGIWAISTWFVRGEDRVDSPAPSLWGNLGSRAILRDFDDFGDFS